MDLTNDPIPGLVRKIAVPVIVGVFFDTMYGVVDTFFAGFISTEALAALSISSPVFFFILSLSFGISQGSTVLIANALGEKEHEKAHEICVQSISFGCLFAAVLTVIGLLVAPTMLRVLGATGEYLRIALDYLNLILCGTFFLVLGNVLNAGLRAEGDTKPIRNVMIAGFFLNCALDPWFMFGGFGIPAMGIKGLALATVIILFLGAVYLSYKLSRTRLWEGPFVAMLAPSRTCLEIARQGLPASFNMASMAFLWFIATFYVSKFSTEGVAAYGIGVRIEVFFLIPMYGLSTALLSMTGQNNGANKPERIRETLKTTMKYGLIIAGAGGIFLFLLANPLMTIFTDDPLVIKHGAIFLKITAFTLCGRVIHIQTNSLLQGLKKPFPVIVISLFRHVLVPCILGYFLAFQLGMRESGVWWSWFIVVWIAAIVSYFYGQHVLRQRLASTEEPAESSVAVS
jgi:putative MATE family efflux protein